MAPRKGPRSNGRTKEREGKEGSRHLRIFRSEYRLRAGFLMNRCLIGVKENGRNRRTGEWVWLYDFYDFFASY